MHRQLLPVVPIQLIIFQAVCYTCTLYHITQILREQQQPYLFDDT